LLPILAACSCEESVQTATGVVVPEPKSLDFGGVFLGEEGAKQVVFSNRGATRVTLSVGEMPAAFVTKTPTLEIGPGAKATWTFAFVPEIVGVASGEATIVVSGAKTKSITIPVQGEGLARDVGVVDLDFGIVPVGDQKTLPLPISSGSTVPLKAQLRLEGTDAASFSVNVTELDIPAGMTANAQVTFTPVGPSVHSARILVKTCADCREQAVRLSGQGAVADLRPVPGSLDFGLVTPGGSSTKSLRVVNNGSLPVMVGGMSLDPEGGPNFVVDTTGYPREIAGNTSIDMDVSFQPPVGVELVQQANALRFYGADGTTLLFEVPMVGTPGGPDLVVAPEVVDFGQQPVRYLVEQTVTVRNVGEPGDARVVDAFVEGPGEAAFTVEPSPALPADVGTGVAAFKVKYFATAAVESSAELVIVTDDVEEPEFRVRLQGSARATAPCDLVVNPPNLRFGLVANGGEYTRSVDVINRGTEDCLIWDVTLDESGSPFFTTAGVPTGTAVIPPNNGRLPLTIRFKPQGLQNVRENSTLYFRHTSPDISPVAVPISGMPSRYDLRATPNPVAFGSWAQGARTFLNLTLENHGLFGATVVGANRSADTVDKFGITPQLGVPGPIAAEGGSVIFSASYAPNGIGPDAGQYEIFIQEATEPVIVDAQGFGLDQDCGDLCAAPTAICPAAQTVNVNNQIMLAGAGSDPTGDALNCTWRVVSAPQGSREAPGNPAQCITPFTPDIVGDYQIELTVTDPMGNTDTCLTEVHANPFGGLWVEMYWAVNGDIDLHVLHPNAGNPMTRASWTDNQWTCFYANCQPHSTPPAWDTPSPNDDPSLDRDDIPGTGPENIRINQPSTTHVYNVGFKNFSNQNLPNQVTYNIYCGGALVNAGQNTYASPPSGQWVWVGEVQYSNSGPCTFTQRNTVVP